MLLSSSFYGKNLTIMTFNVDICFLYATIINTVLLCYKFFNYNISRLNIFQKIPLKKTQKGEYKHQSEWVSNKQQKSD